MSAHDRLAGPLVWCDQALGRIESGLNLISGCLIFLLMCLGVLQVILRSVFSSPLFGFVDLVEVTMVGFAVLSIAFVQRVGSHVRMELVLQHLSGRALWLAELVGASVAIFIVVVLIPFSYDHFYRAFSFGDSTIDLELVTWPAKLIVPIALSVLLMRWVLQWFGYLRMLIDPERSSLAVPVVKRTHELALEEIRLTDVTSNQQPDK